MICHGGDPGTESPTGGDQSCRDELANSTIAVQTGAPLRIIRSVESMSEGNKNAGAKASFAINVTDTIWLRNRLRSRFVVTKGR